MSITLQNYLTDAQRLLHDATNRFWTVDELTDYVNKARKLIAVETACTRKVIPLDILATTTLAGATYNLDTIYPTQRVMDVMDVLLNYSSNTIYQLRFIPYAMMVRTILWQYQSPGTPTHYTVNNRQLYVLQWPGLDYKGSSVDCLLEPLDLVNTTDVDNDIAFPFSEAVGFYVAYLAKVKDQRRTEAEEFYRDFVRRTAQALSSTMTRRIVNQ